MKANGPKTFTIGSGGASANRLVKLDSDGDVIHNTATSSDDPIGVTLGYGDEGDDVAVEFLAKDGTLEIEAAGAIELGAEVFAAAAGKVQELPDAHATYRKIGKALQAASGSGSVIEVLPYDFQATVTVS
jgi:hypothetical protein